MEAWRKHKFNSLHQAKLDAHKVMKENEKNLRRHTHIQVRGKIQRLT
jgi:hypothetical protein